MPYTYNWKNSTAFNQVTFSKRKKLYSIRAWNNNSAKENITIRRKATENFRSIKRQSPSRKHINQCEGLPNVMRTCVIRYATLTIRQVLAICYCVKLSTNDHENKLPCYGDSKTNICCLIQETDANNCAFWCIESSLHSYCFALESLKLDKLLTLY